MWNGKGKEESTMISRFLAQVTGWIAGLYTAIKKHRDRIWEIKFGWEHTIFGMAPR